MNKELMGALKAAHDAGDIESAKKIAAMIDAPAKVPQPEQPKLKGAVRQGLQGMTFGLSDEVGAGVASVPAAIHDAKNGRGFHPVNAYNDIHQSLQDERNQFKKDSPKTALAAELVGGITTGGVGASRMLSSQALKHAPAIVKPMVVGGVEGSIYGGASADRGERAKGAAIGGGAGVVLAPPLQLAGHLARSVGRPVVDWAKRSVLSNPRGDARKYLADILAREGIDNIDQVGTVAQRKMASLADVSEGSRGAVEGIVSDVQNPAVRAQASKVLNARNRGMTSRVLDKLDDELSLPANATIKQAQEQIKQLRSDTASRLYTQAKSQPLKATTELNRVLKIPEFDRALRLAQKRVMAKRVNNETITHIDIVDEAKKIIDDQIGTLVRQGKKNRVRDLVQAKNTLLREVDAQIPSYKQARNAYASDSALIEAGEQGKKLLRQDIDYLDDLIEGMGDSEKVMFRLGAKKAIRERMMQAREGTNSINRITSEINLERIKKAFPDEKAYKQFKGDLDFEAQIFETSRILSNSLTALRQAAQRDMQGGGAGQFNQIGQDTAGLVANAIQRLFSRGLSKEGKEELGKMLLTPINDLSPSLKRELNNRILKATPLRAKGQTQTFIRDVLHGAPVAAGGIGVPMVANY